jgi:hypothetical protein
LPAEGFEQAGEEMGAEAGRHEGDDARRVSHKPRMNNSPENGNCSFTVTITFTKKPSIRLRVAGWQ